LHRRPARSGAAHDGGAAAATPGSSGRGRGARRRDRDPGRATRPMDATAPGTESTTTRWCCGRWRRVRAPTAARAPVSGSRLLTRFSLRVVQRMRRPLSRPLCERRHRVKRRSALR
jgi:hypothetical protein